MLLSLFVGQNFDTITLDKERIYTYIHRILWDVYVHTIQYIYDDDEVSILI